MQQPAVFAEKADWDELTRTPRNFHYWSKKTFCTQALPKGACLRGRQAGRNGAYLKITPAGILFRQTVKYDRS